MKKKMRKILFDSWRAAGTKTVICFLVILAAASLLSLTLFFVWGDSIENTFASSIKLQLSYTNESYVSNNYKYGGDKSEIIDQDASMNQQIYVTFLDSLKEFSQNPEITYFNYNFEREFTTDQQDTVTVFGMNDVRFLDHENLTITQGTGDIQQNEALISDRTMLRLADKDGSYSMRSPEIGETIAFVNEIAGDKSVLFKVTIAGIYHIDYKYAAGNRSEDDFINSKGMIVRNSVFEDILKEHPDYYGKSVTGSIEFYGISNATGKSEKITDPKYFTGPAGLDYKLMQQDYSNINPIRRVKYYLPVIINHIVMETDTLEDYLTLKEKFYTFGTNANRTVAKIIDPYVKSHSSSEVKFMLQTNENCFGSILDSISRIKIFYQFIFLSIYLLLVLSIYGFIRYLQYGRAREIFIQYSLGRSRHNIIKYYMRYYALPGLLISMIACIPGYLLSWMLSVNTAAASAQRQNEFIRVTSDKNLIQYSGISFFNLSWQRALAVFAAVVLIMELVIMICAWISTRKVLRGSLSNHARGGR